MNDIQKRNKMLEKLFPGITEDPVGGFFLILAAAKMHARKRRQSDPPPQYEPDDVGLEREEGDS